MATSAARLRSEPVIPNQRLVEDARNLLHRLPDEQPRFTLLDRADGTALDLDLPPEVYAIVRDVLTALARNQAISVLPMALELTTNETADLLNVSRGYVIKLITEAALPHRMVGTHRRVKLEDALAYRATMQARTSKALDEMARIDLELGLVD
jgi:excisionase family DNA binding protein